MNPSARIVSGLVFALASIRPGSAGDAAVEPTVEPAAEPITFIVTSDSHYDAFENEDRNERTRVTIEEMNRIQEARWPDEIGGGPIGHPAGVLVLGDVIDDGDRVIDGKSQSAVQWARYVADFGLDGTDGLLRYPVQECVGNHDGPPQGRERFGFSFQAELKRRNLIRKEKGRISSLSADGLHSSWDWGPVHLVMLNLYPGSSPHPKTRYSPAYHDPQKSLEFLKADLAERVGKSGRPVILLHHYDLQGSDWWHEEERKAYYDAIRDYDVIAIFHGHTGTGVYGWKPGADEKGELAKGGDTKDDAEGDVRKGDAAKPLDVVNTGQTERGFFLVEVTETQFRVAYRVKRERDKAWDGTWTWTHFLRKELPRRACVAPGILSGPRGPGCATAPVRRPAEGTRDRAPPEGAGPSAEAPVIGKE